MKIIAIIIFLSILISSNVRAEAWEFTDAQRNVLNIAYVEGHKIGMTTIIQAMVIQESDAGIFKEGDKKQKLLKRSFGAMQLKISTVKMLIEMNNLDITFKSDMELRKILMYDDTFNIKMGCLYIKYLMKVFRKNISKAVLAYNVGLSNVRENGTDWDPNNYLNSVYKKSKAMAKFNLEEIIRYDKF